MTATRLAHRTWGDRGPDVVWLHGGATDGSAWAPIASALADDARCVALDLRGYGAGPRSAVTPTIPGPAVTAPAAGDYSVTACSGRYDPGSPPGRNSSGSRSGRYGVLQSRDDVLATLDALGLARPVLDGHSSGAVIACLAAAAAPDRFAGLILEEPPPLDPHD